MKYPYISKSGNALGYLVLNESNVWSFQNEEWITFNTRDFKNDTPEFLTNTYGEVKSKEHAEFIVKLAEVNGFHYFDYQPKSKFFCVSDDILYFVCCEDKARNDGEKQITIPLPPELNTNTPEEDFEMKQIAKNNKPKLAGVEEVIRDSLNENGDNLIFGGDDKCKEWPCVNDEVLINIDFDKYDVKYGKEVNGENGVVRSIFKDGDVTVYAVSVDGTCYCFVRGLLSEPKTPAQQLQDEMKSIVDLAMKATSKGVDFHADSFLDLALVKYSITKKGK